MKHVKTIIKKEWAEVFQNRMVLYTTILTPLLFVAIPLLVIFFTNQSFGANLPGNTPDLPAEFLPFCEPGMASDDCMLIYLVNTMMMLFMIMPVIIPVTIAAYSIVGEKNTRSLEPLLATPITTFELLAGKSLAAAIPAFISGWFSFGVFVLGLSLLGVSQPVMHHILSLTWLLAVFAAGPLLSIAAVNFVLFISSRVNDPRVAEQISVLLILPILGALVAQVVGVIVINVFVVISFIGAMVLLDIGLIYLGVTIFERETILTRWK